MTTPAQRLLASPEISPEAALQVVGAPEGFMDAFLSLSGPQRLYLIKRLNTPTHAEATRQAGVGEQTVYTWRSQWPAFRLCEQAVMDARGSASLQLARAIYKAAMPEVAMRQVDQALEDHKDLSDRQLMAQQRAREAVSKGAGLEEGALVPGEERLEMVALRLWRRA